MGLDTTHDAFHGAYSAFHHFRKAVMEAWGGSWPPHDDETKDPSAFYTPEEADRSTHPGLWAFFTSQDCEGSFAPDVCAQMAHEIEALLPEIEKLNEKYVGGHIQPTLGDVARRYIAGCRLAAEKGESLEYF